MAMAPAADPWRSVGFSSSLSGALLKFHTGASRHHAVRVVVCTKNCAVREKHAGSSSPYSEGRSNRASSMSRRGLLAGLTTLAGAGGINLLLSPTTVAINSKQTKLPIEDVKKIIEADIVQRQYPVTGNLTESIYDENCRFQDPVGDYPGLKKYTAALKLLFDPVSSLHEILNIKVTGPHTVEVNWRLRGYMKFPWHPYIPPYEGITTYTTDDGGLIVSHSETWSISPLTAIIQFLTPSWLSKDAPT